MKPNPYHTDPMQESDSLLTHRLKLCSSVATGVTPSNKQLIATMIRHLTGSKTPTGTELVELARTLFPPKNGLEKAYDQT